jgi:ornithine--oxo-acid transaminase
MSRRPIDLIAVPTALGAPDAGTALGPLALQRAGLLTALHRCGREVLGSTVVTPPQATADRWTALSELCEQLAQTVAQSRQAGHLPLVLGGDHSIAAGTWRGVAQAACGPIGLLWIDAHLDAHTPEDSPSGNPHGMPLAMVLGMGDARLSHACVLPQHVCVLGARDWEPEEMQRLRERGVRVISDADIARQGLQAALAQAVDLVCTGTAGFGLTLDLDVLPPEEAPGVNSPAPGGQPAGAWLAALRGLANRPACLCLEIVECDGVRDASGATAQQAVALISSLLTMKAQDLIALENACGAHNYAPLPVVLSRARGCRVWDSEGREYLDMMATYSAVSFGHAHPRLLRALTEQAGRLAVTSRAYYNDVLPVFLRRLTELTGYERALPVNTGVEAVETALKAARKWGHKVKHIPPDQAEIIACEGNFHGRTITVVGLSSEAQYRDGFGPFPPGLRTIAYGDAAALEAAITPHTAAFLVEPIQGEGGIVVPPDGYLAACAQICRDRGVLLICDEVQTGLGRTGKLLASEHEGVRPDGLILGKALGGGLYPVSAFLADESLMQVFTPGDHGSTFGGNALAAAVGLAALDVLVEEKLAERAAELGQWFMQQLRQLKSPLIREVRGRGLLIGMEVDTQRISARELAEALLSAGILTKDTHGKVIRLTPPLTITQEELHIALNCIRTTLVVGMHP